MDITLQELKTMKSKQLRRIIREAINEVLVEDAAKVKNLKLKATQLRQQAIDAEQAASAEEEKDLQQNKAAVAEGDMYEMARIAKGFRLANPNFDAAPYADKRVSGVSMEDIINFFRENPGAEKSQLQSQFGFVRPQIANAVVNGLLDAGVLVKLGAGGEVEATPEPGEEQPETVDGPEAMFIGSGNPLAQYFDKEPNEDGEEDFNDAEEPTAGEIGGQPASASSMSDEDYEAFMKYTDLKGQLDATKSNIIKMKRSKGGAAGDIKDRPSSDLERLSALKKSLEDRIDALVAGSDYLKKRTGQSTATPEVPETEEDETIDEGLDEYTIRKMQFYAGIRK